MKFLKSFLSIFIIFSMHNNSTYGMQRHPYKYMPVIQEDSVEDEHKHEQTHIHIPDPQEQPEEPKVHSKSKKLAHLGNACCTLSAVAIPAVLLYIVASFEHLPSAPIQKMKVNQILPYAPPYCEFNTPRNNTRDITGQNWVLGLVNRDNNFLKHSSITYCPTPLTDNELLSCMKKTFRPPDFPELICLTPHLNPQAHCTPFLAASLCLPHQGSNPHSNSSKKALQRSNQVHTKFRKRKGK